MAVVSIVTPVYNGERYLRACIESVLDQSFSDWEYVIVDNCSSDNSRSIAESYAKDKRIRIHHNKQVLPVTASFNRAASLASPKSRYLKFLCADDLLFPNCLELMVNLAEAKPNVRLVGSYRIVGKYADSDGPPFPDDIVCGKELCKLFFQARMSAFGSPRNPMAGVLGSPSSHMIRLASVPVGKHLFDETFAAHADSEFFIRLLKDEGDFGFVHQVLTFSRVHDASVTAKFSNILGTGVLESLVMLAKHGSAFLSEKEQKALTRANRKMYCRFLFRALLKVWDRQIWKYHTMSWNKLGIQVSMFEILKWGFWELAMSATHIADTMNRFRNEYSRMKSKRSIRF